MARCRVVADDPRPVWEDTHHVLVNEDNVRSDMVVTVREIDEGFVWYFADCKLTHR